MRTLVRSLAAAAVATTLLAPPALATEGTPAPAPTTTATKEFRNTCDPAKATLPGVVEGAPALQPGAKAGLYVWHDKKGWRIRYTHDLAPVDGKAQRVEVRGMVTSSRPISNVRLVKLEPKQRGEGVSVKRPGRKVLGFTFINYGGIDGVNFAAGCAGKLTFTVWTVTRNPDGKLVRDTDGKVLRKPVRILFGKDSIEALEQTPANPGLLGVPNDVTKVRVLRTPPPVASPAPTA